MQPAAAAVRTRVTTRADALALVVVGAGAEDQRALALFGQHGADGADVAHHAGGEAGDFGRGEGGGGLADQFGGVAPARAEDQGDVVARRRPVSSAM